MSSFGQILLRSDLEDAVIAVLKKWMDTYLAEVERQNGKPVRTLPRPRSYSRRNEFDKWPEEQLPAIIVVSPGTTGRPRKRGNGEHEVDWAVGVAVIASSTTMDNSRNLIDLYTAAIRALIVQRPSLEGFAIAATWQNESYDDINDQEAGRTMASGQVVFEITVENNVFAKAGPLTPDNPPDPPPNTSPTDPQVQTTHLDVELERIT